MVYAETEACMIMHFMQVYADHEALHQPYAPDRDQSALFNCFLGMVALAEER